MINKNPDFFIYTNIRIGKTTKYIHIFNLYHIITFVKRDFEYMKRDFELTIEERTLIQLLFGEKNISNEVFNSIDYNLLVKIASSHLSLPSLYVNLIRKKYIHKIPTELKDYLKKIYLINRNRNTILIKELKELSDLFNKNKIRYVYLKGASLLSGDYFKDIGERMVGDIDILIFDKQKEKVFNLLNSKSYFNKYNYKFWDANVYPNFINKDKLFSIDIHSKLFPKKYDYLMNSKNVIENSVRLKNGISILNKADEYYYSIYNYQISDYGNMKASYSFRKIYDVFRILKKYKPEKNCNDKFINNYMIIMNLLNIRNGSQIDINGFNIFKERFKLKMRNRFYFIIDNIICQIIIFFEYFHLKLIEFIINKEYRINSLKKLKIIR
tara:strand:+ start:368 stop:1516 length:1149 start_codon:yes stop_codon:yes gene_type:complete